MAHSAAHPGFDAVSNKIAHEINKKTGKPYGAKLGDEIAAAAARNASKRAHQANPRLYRVKGK